MDHASMTYDEFLGSLGPDPERRLSAQERTAAEQIFFDIAGDNSAFLDRGVSAIRGARTVGEITRVLTSLRAGEAPPVSPWRIPTGGIFLPGVLVGFGALIAALVMAFA